MSKKVKNIIIAIILIIVIFLVGFFIYKNIQENDISKLEIYNYEEDPNYIKCTEMEGVEFSYPSNYKSVGSSSQPTFMDPDIAGTSVNLISEDSQSLSIKNYIKQSLDSMKKFLNIQGDIEEKYINLNGVKAAKLDYVAKQNGSDVKVTQVAIIKSGKAYILTVGCLPEDSETIKEKSDKIIKSFK